jgi:hypothetical protein
MAQIRCHTLATLFLRGINLPGVLNTTNWTSRTSYNISEGCQFDRLVECHKLDITHILRHHQGFCQQIHKKFAYPLQYHGVVVSLTTSANMPLPRCSPEVPSPYVRMFSLAYNHVGVYIPPVVKFLS